MVMTETQLSNTPSMLEIRDWSSNDSALLMPHESILGSGFVAPMKDFGYRFIEWQGLVW